MYFYFLHLSVFENASVGLSFVRFTLRMDVGVRENYLFIITCDIKVD